MSSEKMKDWESYGLERVEGIIGNVWRTKVSV